MATGHPAQSSDRFCVGMIACSSGHGQPEAYVFWAKEKNPEELLLRQLRAARAAAAGTPYAGAEFRAANLWLADIVRAGKEKDVQFVILKRSLTSAAAADAEKNRVIQDLVSLGIRLPVQEPDDFQHRRERLRGILAKNGLCPNQPIQHITGSGVDRGIRLTLRLPGSEETKREILTLGARMLRNCGFGVTSADSWDGGVIWDVEGASMTSSVAADNTVVVEATIATLAEARSSDAFEAVVQDLRDALARLPDAMALDRQRDSHAAFAKSCEWQSFLTDWDFPGRYVEPALGPHGPGHDRNEDCLEDMLISPRPHVAP